MGPLIAADVMLLVFTIYVGIFFKYFHSSYPEMEVGFHLWEVCYDERTWKYGNKLAGNLAIGLGLLFFGIIFPLLIYIEMKRSYLSVLIILLAIVYFLLLFGLVKVIMRRKFKISDK